MPEQELKYNLEALRGHGVAFPKPLALSILRRHLIDAPAEALVRGAWPWVFGSGQAAGSPQLPRGDSGEASAAFDPMAPTVCGVGGSEEECATAFQQYVVVDRAANLMSDMEAAVAAPEGGQGMEQQMRAAAADLGALAEALRTVSEEAGAPPGDSPLLLQVTQSARQWVETAAAIAGTSTDMPAMAMSSGLAALACVNFAGSLITNKNRSTPRRSS